MPKPVDPGAVVPPGAAGLAPPDTASAADQVAPAPGGRPRARILSSGLAVLAGLACVGCCAVPVLIGAGVLAGSGWAVFGSWLPGLTVVLAVLAAGAWWWAGRRRHATGCAGGACGCAS